MLLLAYTFIGGLLMDVPRRYILNESIRNLYFHVPMWFGMIIILGASAFHSIQYLRLASIRNDNLAQSSAHVGLLFGLLGLLTGMLWANYTWGKPWSNDPKQNGAAIGIILYLAYFILRNSMEDDSKKARLAAVYNIFSFPMFIAVIFILPRLTDSLHPGSGGNPGFNAYDLDSRMRMIFYPAVLGWTLLGWWVVTLRNRSLNLKSESEND